MSSCYHECPCCLLVLVMKIGELSSATGVDTDTIRFYEKSGILQSPSRQSNGYRAYGAEHVESLAFVKHCRALDIPLADVGRLLNFTSSVAEDCGDINQLIDQQIKRVRARLASLKALEKQLVALRGRCRDPHPVKECGILSELVAAAQGDSCACHPA